MYVDYGILLKMDEKWQWQISVLASQTTFCTEQIITNVHTSSPRLHSDYFLVLLRYEPTVGRRWGYKCQAAHFFLTSCEAETEKEHRQATFYSAQPSLLLMGAEAFTLTLCWEQGATAPHGNSRKEVRAPTPWTGRKLNSRFTCGTVALLANWPSAREVDREKKRRDLDFKYFIHIQWNKTHTHTRSKSVT